MLRKFFAVAPGLSNEEVLLWEAYESARDIPTRNALAKFYRPLVEKWTYHIITSRSLPVTIDDVMGAVWERVLLFTIPKYDRRRGLSFTTFAGTHIRGAILDVLRDEDWVPRLIRSQQAAVQATIESLTYQHGRPPTDKQIARRLRISLPKLQKILAEIQPVNVTSMNVACHVRSPKYDNSSEWSKERSTLLEDRRELSPPQVQQRHDLLDRVCCSCNDIEKAILVGRYYRGQTMKALSKSLGLSESRISQIHASLLERLRVVMADRCDEFVL